MLNKDVHLELQLYQVLSTDSKTNIEMTIEINPIQDYYFLITKSTL